MSKRKIDATAYNRQLVDAIEKLKRVVEEKITPENIHFFSPQFIKRLEKTYNHLFDDSGMVNSIDNYKFNSLIRHLKTNKVKYYRSYNIFSDLDVTNFNIRLEVPEKFDGRNSFVLPFFKYVGSNVSQKFESNKAYRSNKCREDLKIIRNESFIKITDEYIDKNDPDYDGYDKSVTMLLFILFWRYV